MLDSDRVEGALWGMDSRASRRRFLGAGALITAAAALPGGWRLSGADAESVDLGFENGTRPLVAYPGKRPMLRLTSRPPQLETPFEVFRSGAFTPNDAFFVRYHLAPAPPLVDPVTYRLKISGFVERELVLDLAGLKHDFEPVELNAVNQCSGNSRGFFKPRVPGGQSGNGNMGCARWRGVRLKDILQKAGMKAGARSVAFNGLDAPIMATIPDFVKALEADHALSDEVLLAYSMNGEDLPVLNGYPLRLVVPGFYGTYWVKHLSEIKVQDAAFEGYWMKTAYRIPDTPGACIDPGTTAKRTIPIHRMNVRSFLTSHPDGARVVVGAPTGVGGIAFDGGEGIRSVEFSTDDGRSWKEAILGADHGRFAFREWKTEFVPTAAGSLKLRVRAFNRLGQSQPLDPLWNPAGYMRNVVETVNLNAGRES